MSQEIDRLFICACNNIEHQIIMRYWENDVNPLVYASVYLSKERNVFKRIWKGLKYIFGHTSNYGDFDEFIFKSDDADTLQEVVDYLKNNKKIKENKHDK